MTGIVTRPGTELTWTPAHDRYCVAVPSPAQKRRLRIVAIVIAVAMLLPALVGAIEALSST